MKGGLVLFFLAYGLVCFAQGGKGSFGNCDRIVKIDSIEYKSNFVKCYRLSKANMPKKINGQIVIKTSKGELIFRDDFTDGNYREYQCYGTDTATKIVFIVATYYHDSDGFLINTTSGKIDTTLGDPYIYGNKVVSFEQVPDSRPKIQIAKYGRGGIFDIKTFSIPKCASKAIADSCELGSFDEAKTYLRDEFLYITENQCYYKLKLEP